MKNDKIIAQCFAMSRNVKCDNILNFYMQKKLMEQGIYFRAIERVVKTISVTYQGRKLWGVGFKNENGGYGFYSQELFSHPIDLIKPGSIYIPYKKKEYSPACCVFYDIVDYLSFMTLNDVENGYLPKKCDSIIVSSPPCFVQAMLNCESYEHIYCFLPRNAMGQTMAKTIMHRNRARSEDMSYLYGPHQTIHEFLTATSKEKAT